MKRWRYDRILSSENILITNSHIWIGLDILLGLKTEGILQHCTASLSWDREWEYHVWVEVWVWVWVWVCRLPLPLPILSQDTVGIGVWSVTGQSPRSAKSRHRYSPPQPRRSPCVGCATGASVGLIRLGVTCIGDESPMLVM